MKSSKPVSSRQIIGVVVVAIVLLAAIIGLSTYFQKKNSDDESALNKDVALRTLWDKTAIIGEYESKNVILTNKDEIFVMLQSGSWKYLPDGAENVLPELSFYIDEDYSVSICKDGIAVICYNGEKRYYETPSGIVDDIISYIEDTTVIAIEDASAFLSVSSNITVTIQGSSKTVSSGAKLASVLNMDTWSEINSVKPDLEPLFIVDNRNGLKISIFGSLNIGVVEYNGAQTVYEIDELTIASSELVAKSYFNDIAADFTDKMKSADSYVITVNGEDFNLSPDTAVDSLLDVSKWERRFKKPVGLASNADIVINGGSSFTVSLYSSQSVAEFENAYYTVPSSVFSSITEYLKNDEDKSEVVVNLKSTLLSEISKKNQISVKYSGNDYIVSVASDISSALGMSSWTESPVSELSGEPDIVFTINTVPVLSLSFYSARNYVSVVNGSETQVYKISSSIYDSLVHYIQENLYTEAWAVSATELGGLQKTAESVDVMITDSSSYREKYSESVDSAVPVLAALDLLPTEDIPDITSTEKTDILFKGKENFVMSIYPSSDGNVLVNVSGTFYSMGKYIDRWFTCNSSYTELVSSLKDVNARGLDTVAALFGEALRTGDIDALNRLIGTSAFDYSGISTLMLNDLYISNTDTQGMYIVSLNVAYPMDSPFTEGLTDYVLIVGSSGGNTSVLSFVPSDEYELANSEDPAVSAVDLFTSWTDAAGIAFSSINEFENKSSVAAYLMLLCSKNGLGTVSEDNPSIVCFTEQEISSAAKKYFGIDNWDPTNVSSYDTENGIYLYEGRSAPLRYKRAAAVSYDESGKAVVTYNWYSDPLLLYITDTVIYTLDKNEDGSYAVISASLPVSEDISDTSDDNDVQEDEASPDDETLPSDETPSTGDNETSEPDDTTVFSAPTGLSATETMFKYFEYLNEKNAEKANSMLYESYVKGESEYNFDALEKISVVSCAEIPNDFDWYEPWYKDPSSYTCVVAEIEVDCADKEYSVYSKGLNSIEIYMIKTSDTSDWRIIAEKQGGSGILGQ